ncbi:hypothetical protein, partial [Dubosiella newyorkensis]|uniref:hypothetical protein n=1 Tax=Dubosiella newyorkensis TaxID=1862672 RepID=UPI00272D97E7
MTTIRKAEIFSILLFLFLSLACLFYPSSTAMVLIRMTALIGLASGLLFFFDAFHAGGLLPRNLRRHHHRPALRLRGSHPGGEEQVHRQ